MDAADQCCICGATAFEPVFRYTEPPAGEVKFDFGPGPYRREVWRCRNCGHFVSVHDIDMVGLYSGHYVNTTYGSDGLHTAFERINALPPERADNVGRVQRVSEFASAHFAARSAGFAPRVLDVGSGLCVFLYRLHQVTGWPCTALDPDQRAVEHARSAAGVQAVCADFMQAGDLGRFDLITLNKVIEHVLDPVAMLVRAARLLNPGALVYVEVPDGTAAMVEGAGREEFFIDHHHMFSSDSLRIAAARAGFDVLALERLREPSTKFTLRAFLSGSAT